MPHTLFQQGSLRIRRRVRGPALWEFRYRVTDDHGQRKLKSLILGTTGQYPTKADLVPKLTALLVSINNGLPPRQSVTMDVLINRYVAEERLEEIKAGITPSDVALHYSTARGYLAILYKHIRPRWGSLSLSAVRPAAIQEWLNGLPVAPKTRANIRGVLRQLFNKAMLWELADLQRNPIDLVKIKGVTKRQKPPTVLTVEQFHAILARLPLMQRTMVTVAQLTGLRISEVLALQWKDIDFDQLTLQVTRGVVNGRVNRLKTEYSKDLLPLHASLAKVLREWQSNAPPSSEGWVFANPITLRPYNGSSLGKRHLREIGKELGVRLGWHTFRHTYRSWLDATGAPIGVQQKLMRHAQVSTTMNVYGNALMQSKRDANSKIVSMVLEGQRNSEAGQS